MKSELKHFIHTEENRLFSYKICNGSLANEIAKWYSMHDETIGEFLRRISIDIDIVAKYC